MATEICQVKFSENVFIYCAFRWGDLFNAYCGRTHLWVHFPKAAATTRSPIHLEAAAVTAVGRRGGAAFGVEGFEVETFSLMSSSSSRIRFHFNHRCHLKYSLYPAGSGSVSPRQGESVFINN